MPRLVDQMKETLAGFAVCRTPPALIGGLALAAHHVVRATRDIDFLVDLDDADRLHEMVLGLGYRWLHRSESERDTCCRPVPGSRESGATPCEFVGAASAAMLFTSFRCSRPVRE